MQIQESVLFSINNILWKNGYWYFIQKKKKVTTAVMAYYCLQTLHKETIDISCCSVERKK